ncbi:MAG TPA: DUF3551 domain-containing protein [Xanthobacteraceae bacterium]|nr:DUF3551 domain-containing protein [Xanthobacteraceae bacterium]
MNKIAIAAALLAALAATGSASAQDERVRPNERYCLEPIDGGQGGGGGGSFICRYETMAQCLASKTGQSDRCMLNPRLAGQPIR